MYGEPQYPSREAMKIQCEHLRNGPIRLFMGSGAHFVTSFQQVRIGPQLWNSNVSLISWNCFSTTHFIMHDCTSPSWTEPIYKFHYLRIQTILLQLQNSIPRVYCKDVLWILENCFGSFIFRRLLICSWFSVCWIKDFDVFQIVCWKRCSNIRRWICTTQLIGSRRSVTRKAT